MRKIKCFIASAIGKDDVDLIYKNSFEKVLTELHIEPKRVDLIEYNDDIDDKIIELIQTCDICIADLTYARPSVYFESGYFTGLNKPVIFTARSDHFKPNIEDIYGNFKIHFDLQMKNIIQWNSTSNVKTFNNKLRKRLNHVSEPIIKAIDDGNRLQKSKNDFNKLSQVNKLKRIERVFKSKIAGYNWHTFNYVGLFRPISSDFIAYRKEQKVAVAFITKSATKEYLRFLTKERISSPNWYENGLNISHCHVFIISLRKVPTSRIEDTFPDYELIEDNFSIYDAGQYQKCKFIYYFLDGISSLIELRNSLTKLLKILD